MYTFHTCTHVHLHIYEYMYNNVFINMHMNENILHISAHLCTCMYIDVYKATPNTHHLLITDV